MAGFYETRRTDNWNAIFLGGNRVFPRGRGDWFVFIRLEKIETVDSLVQGLAVGISGFASEFLWWLRMAG